MVKKRRSTTGCPHKKKLSKLEKPLLIKIKPKIDMPSLTLLYSAVLCNGVIACSKNLSKLAKPLLIKIKPKISRVTKQASLSSIWNFNNTLGLSVPTKKMVL